MYTVVLEREKGEVIERERESKGTYTHTHTEERKMSKRTGERKRPK